MPQEAPLAPCRQRRLFAPIALHGNMQQLKVNFMLYQHHGCDVAFAGKLALRTIPADCQRTHGDARSILDETEAHVYVQLVAVLVH